MNSAASRQQTDGEQVSWIVADGHVHIHERFSLSLLFTSALRHLHAAAQSLSIEGAPSFFLLLTESAGIDRFHQLRGNRDGQLPDGFRIAPTGETNSLRITDGREHTLSVIAGRQIVTRERLEVLALGLSDPYPDGKPLSEVLEELRRTESIRVIPWGAGKWLGARGRVLAAVLDKVQGPIFLGDNGNRPFFWPRPALFARAAAKGIHNLPGSDPLPFSGQERRVGSFGFALPARLDRETPFACLKSALDERYGAIQTFGRAERFWPFLINQLAMQISMRKK